MYTCLHTYIYLYRLICDLLFMHIHTCINTWGVVKSQKHWLRMFCYAFSWGFCNICFRGTIQNYSTKHIIKIFTKSHWRYDHAAIQGSFSLVLTKLGTPLNPVLNSLNLEWPLEHRIKKSDWPVNSLWEVSKHTLRNKTADNITSLILEKTKSSQSRFSI